MKRSEKAVTVETGAEHVHWNLNDLYPNLETLDQDLQVADEEAERFAGRYRDRLASLSARDLCLALNDFEEIHDRLGRAYTFAYLYWTTDTENPERGAVLQRVREQYVRINQKLIFFELEWARLDDERAKALIEDEQLHGYRHYLEVQRLNREHLLSEPEEKIMAEKSVTGRGAWNRFFDETLGAARFSFRGEQLTEQEVLSKLYEPDREVRRDAALSLTEGLKSHLRELTYVSNTLLADKASDDRVRQYPNWLTSRNIANEISDEMVQALIESVTGRYDLVARFYGLKKKLLGLDEMFDYDRYAPVGEAGTLYHWDDARDVVLDAYYRFHPQMGQIARFFFDGEWIDAALRPGKRGGAFSHGAVPSSHPYILMNYTGKVRDVQTLAHELGHGIHQYLSRKQGVLQADTPLTTAETASVFGEMLVFNDLIRQESEPAERLTMLIGKIDDTIATVFRQIAMNRFEDRIHTARRTTGELSPEQFGEHWMETQRAMFQGSVTLGEHYTWWWSYIPHFVHTPGYVYAYAFGELLVLALYARYREEGQVFADGYVRLLEAGGSDWPHTLVGKLGVDLTDTGFWQQGLAAIEELIREAEELAAQIEESRAANAVNRESVNGTP